MLQRIQFVAAVIHKPDLLILDEPFSGLDPVSVRTLRDLVLEEHRRGATILLSTHIMVHAEEVCQHVVMIHQGRKVLDEPVAGLRRQFDSRTILFEPMDPDADLAPLSALPGVEGVEAADGGYRIALASGADAAALIPQVARAVPAARVELARLRLEDIFVGIVTGGLRLEEAARLRATLATEAEGAPA
jgi:ABC-2 type transport system ATP-binding protein